MTMYVPECQSGKEGKRTLKGFDDLDVYIQRGCVSTGFGRWGVRHEEEGWKLSRQRSLCRDGMDTRTGERTLLPLLLQAFLPLLDVGYACAKPASGVDES